jgi:hypothetical protein
MSGIPMTEAERARIKLFAEDGCPIREIARTVGRPVMTVQAYVARIGLSPAHNGGLVLSPPERKIAKALGIAVI